MVSRQSSKPSKTPNVGRRKQFDCRSKPAAKPVESVIRDRRANPFIQAKLERSATVINDAGLHANPAPERSKTVKVSWAKKLDASLSASASDTHAKDNLDVTQSDNIVLDSNRASRKGAEVFFAPGLLQNKSELKLQFGSFCSADQSLVNFAAFELITPLMGPSMSPIRTSNEESVLIDTVEGSDKAMDIHGEFISVDQVPSLTVSSVPTLVDNCEPEFIKMIEDMAAQVWSCSRCFSFKHATAGCTRPIRCWTCSQSGHVRKNCPGIGESFRWAVKESCQSVSQSVPLNKACPEIPNAAADTPYSAPKPSPSPSTLPPPMANFPVDPNRFTPEGWQVEAPWGDDERPARIYITSSSAPLGGMRRGRSPPWSRGRQRQRLMNVCSRLLITL